MEVDLRTPGRAGMKFGSSLGKVVRKGRTKEAGRQGNGKSEGTNSSAVGERPSGRRNSESILAAAVEPSFTPACWQTPTSL